LNGVEDALDSTIINSDLEREKKPAKTCPKLISLIVDPEAVVLSPRQ
jgi:hypothetical protein